MSEERSVVQRLEDIENNQQQKNINEQIGEPFDKYLEKSTVYYYEPDERRFNRHKKKTIVKNFILLFIGVLVLISDFVLAGFEIDLGWYHYCFDIVFTLCMVIPLVCVLKSKNKQLEKSVFNIKNHSFYLVDKMLCDEYSNGLIWIIYTVVRILVTIAMGVVGFYVFITQLDYAGFNAGLIFGKAIVYSMIMFIAFSSDEYWFQSYIFDTDDSYVIMHSWRHWEKIKK